jgi:hypothetical protein
MTNLHETLCDIALGNGYSERALVTALQYTNKPSQLQAIVRFIKGTNTMHDAFELQQLAKDIYALTEAA